MSISIKCTIVLDDLYTQSCNLKHISVCLSVVLAAQWSGVSVLLEMTEGGRVQDWIQHSPPKLCPL